MSRHSGRRPCNSNLDIPVCFRVFICCSSVLCYIKINNINTPAHDSVLNMMFQLMLEGENGLLLNEKQIQDLREARNKTRLPRSLSALAISSVYKNFNCFIDLPDSPLKYLPNAIVQLLLSKISSDIKNREMFMPDPLLMQVLGLLVNPNVTELDCTVFESSYARDKQFNNYLFNEALKNCPKMRKIKLRNKLCQALGYRRYNGGQDDLPVECLKKSWNNLTTIICESDFFCNEDSMMFLQENFPSLEVLSVGIVITGQTTQTMLDHVINMKRLHTLNVYVDVRVGASFKFRQLIPKFIIDVAGGVPSLQNFDFGGGRNNDSNFIDSFGEKYPYKKLLVKKLRIEEGLKRKWPTNLSVKHLIIDGYLEDTEVANLSTLECTLDLAVDCMLAQQMYQVLDCIGGLVETLTIEDMGKVLEERYVEYDTEIILERILTACPNLEHFKYETDMSVVQDPKYNMSPAAFKNYKSFIFNGRNYQYLKQVALQQVYRKFLIGTDVCESLEGLNFEQLQDLAQVVLAYPKSMQQLRELHITPANFNCFSRFDFYNDMNEAFDKYDKCYYELLSCCHKLEKIFLQVSYKSDTKKVTRVNRYMATIQSIDPHFIQKHGGRD